jgi:hypothetical protein
VIPAFFCSECFSLPYYFHPCPRKRASEYWNKRNGDSRLLGNDGLSGIGFSILLSWFAILIQSLNRAESVFNAIIFKINCGKRFGVMDDDTFFDCDFHFVRVLMMTQKALFYAVKLNFFIRQCTD